MHIVAIAGRPDAVEILGIMLDNGFDVNGQTRSGEDTVLHLIVEHIEVKEAFPLVLKILEYIPDLRIRNRVGTFFPGISVYVYYIFRVVCTHYIIAFIFHLPLGQSRI